MRYSLVKAQVLSLGTNAIVALLGAAQAVLVLRLLTPEEYGLVGLALSITSVVGVVQQLGVRAASIREVSQAPTLTEASKVFLTSIATRVSLSLPAAAFIFLSAGNFANAVYEKPAIQLPIQILAFTLLFSGVNALLEGMLTALERFTQFYVYLIFAFALRLVLYAGFVSRFRFIGYFWAELSWLALLNLSLWFLVGKQMKGHWAWPNREEFWRILKSVFGLSLILYLGRVSFSFWKQSGLLVLGFYVDEVQLGYFNLGLTFAGQLLTVSTAISQVYLPTMTRLFNINRQEFLVVLERNFVKVVSVLLLAVATMLLFAEEAVKLLAQESYLPATRVFASLTFAFLIQALFNVISSGILIPARQERRFLVAIVIGRGISIGLTAAFIALGGGIVGAGWGSFLGLLVGLAGMTWIAKRWVGIGLWQWRMGVLVLILAPIMVLSLLDVSLMIRALVYIGVVIVYVVACHYLDVFRLETVWAAVRGQLQNLGSKSSGGEV